MNDVTRLAACGADLGSSDNSRTARREVSRIISAIRRDPSRRWRISELAAMVSLSPSALHRAFTRDVGMSPFTWLGRVRTAEMARLLREADGSMEAIGRQVGWKNRGHATRQFKARIGMTPSQYRVAVRRTRETVCRLCGETLSAFGGGRWGGWRVILLRRVCRCFRACPGRSAPHCPRVPRRFH